MIAVWSIQTVKETFNKAKLNLGTFYRHVITKFTNQQKLNFTCWKIIQNNRAFFYTIYAVCVIEKPTVTQNLRRKLPDVAPGTTKKKFKPTNKNSGTKKVSLLVKIIAHNLTTFWTKVEIFQQETVVTWYQLPKYLTSNMIKTMLYQSATHLLFQI